MVTGILTAAIPALGYLFALLLGEPFVLVTALGGVIALVGVAVASTARDASRRREPAATVARRGPRRGPSAPG
ncbi:hypothetical protein SAMN05216554_4045 [Herbiconiux ginsengi]|uniref:Uncharacterized protein n=1 Tax=Herbiconiux ginsengi TaxID=381665 RepID=A0A1H3TBI2_9MICO|nr:hypothetical protein SAMN05216554_4045 [Herbiconiux ginsengi]